MDTKTRYQIDPEFRKIHIQRVMDSRRKRKAKLKEKKASEKKEEKAWRMLTINEEEYECCKVSHLAQAIARSPKTIAWWFEIDVKPRARNIATSARRSRALLKVRKPNFPSN